MSVFAEEEAAERDAGMAALSRLLPPLKPALLAAVPLPQVLLEPSEDGRPGLAVTAAGALELFVGRHPCSAADSTAGAEAAGSAGGAYDGNSSAYDGSEATAHAAP